MVKIAPIRVTEQFTAFVNEFKDSFSGRSVWADASGMEAFLGGPPDGFTVAERGGFL